MIPLLAKAIHICVKDILLKMLLIKVGVFIIILPISGPSISGWAFPRSSMSPCNFPVDSELTDVKLTACAVSCLKMSGCLAYKFRRNENIADHHVIRGHCALLKQQVTTHTIQLAHTEDWKCYVVARDQ